jgi:type I restriction enzyme S subunit
MKKDWTYKKFEDCIENVKYTTKIQSKDYMASGEYPIISQEEELVSGYWNKNEDVFSAPRPLVVFGDHTRVLKYIDFDFVLGADGVKILLPIEDLEAKFLYYFLKWYNVPNLGYSRHYKLLKEISIPIPPLSIQHSIVAELDLLHSVISKKKEQLRELDNLAQSLFYQMFGDPITNPMGWEIKKLGEVSSLLNGRAYQQKELLDQGKYRVLRVGNFFTNNTWYYSDLELPEDKYCDKGDLLFTWSASFGAHIWNGDKVIYHYHIWKIVLDEMYVDKLFYLHLLNNMVKSMMHDTHGTGMLHLTKSGMEMYDLPLPPLSLQQSFAAKVSAIEAQKQAITQSIKEVEALLAQRMDTYFS